MTCDCEFGWALAEALGATKGDVEFIRFTISYLSRPRESQSAGYDSRKHLRSNASTGGGAGINSRTQAYMERSDPADVSGDGWLESADSVTQSVLSAYMYDSAERSQHRVFVAARIIL